MNTESSKKIFTAFILLVLVWVSITCMIQTFKNPELTQTELFLRIPKSALLNFAN